MAADDDPARAEVLARVRRAAVVAPAGPAKRAAVPPPTGPTPPYPGAGPELSGDDTVLLFTERLAGHGIGVQHVTGVEDLPRVIASALWGRAVRRVVVPRGLPAPWLADLDGVWAMRDDPPRAPLSTRTIESAGAAVTRCAVAVADSGTLVFDGGIGQGRRVLSLLPGFHLCVVEAGQIVPAMADALAALDPARPGTWLTGTTATTAVDGVRVPGVHGPHAIGVIVVG
ncbi:LUD domain-containing protein [Nocardiopsis sediminis]|uniref:LUD domain-containing protein n=1 Tax=Nocardiopsis sediminis TaxID=1778267 RepID=A0ABV8FMT3_9ACTN